MKLFQMLKTTFIYIGGGAILSNCGYEIRDLAKNQIFQLLKH